MDSRKLMIGDYVSLKDGHGKNHVAIVDALLSSGSVSVVLQDGCQALSTSVNPISLTPEILEKNGFVKTPNSIGHIEYFISDDYYDLRIDEITDSLWCVEYDNIEMSFPTCRNLVCHVHELQHALRLCGIEKEIVL